MQVIFTSPDEFGNPSGQELFRGQSHGFSQQNQGSTGQSNPQTNGNLNPGNNPNLGTNQSNGGFGGGQGQMGSGNGQAKKRGRGFASMDPQRVSEIASMGGKAAHAQGVAHEWTTDEARKAGRKGGQASRGRGGNQTQGAGGSF